MEICKLVFVEMGETYKSALSAPPKRFTPKTNPHQIISRTIKIYIFIKFRSLVLEKTPKIYATYIQTVTVTDSQANIL